MDEQGDARVAGGSGLRNPENFLSALIMAKQLPRSLLTSEKALKISEGKQATILASYGGL